MSDLEATIPPHVPVLPAEVLTYLAPATGQIIVDATVGGGGHSRLLADRVGPGGQVIGLDRDARMLAVARARLTGMPVTLIHANFDELPRVLHDLHRDQVDAVVADLGFCSEQVDDPRRGLSFQHDGPLDMRLDLEGEPASSLVNRLDEGELADVFYTYGEERFSRRIARRIVETRRATPYTTTNQLAELVRRCVPRGGKSRIDPATRVFQALRIVVNDELGALERWLAALPRILKPGGRAVVISFHSLEDRLVKTAFRNKDLFEVLTKKPVQAGEVEVQRNPRARSAKLRAARTRTKEV
jgi:16S rRNA (cytosine1402-N4)-methyltransferase